MHKAATQFKTSTYKISSLLTPIIQTHAQRVALAKKIVFHNKWQSVVNGKRYFSSQDDLKQQADSVPVSLQQGGGRMLRTKPIRLSVSLTSAGQIADPWIPNRRIYCTFFIIL